MCFNLFPKMKTKVKLLVVIAFVSHAHRQKKDE